MKGFVIIISCFNSFFIGISTIPTETCLTEYGFLCLNTFGWPSIFFYTQNWLITHLNLSWNLFSWAEDWSHCTLTTWSDCKKKCIHIHMFSSSVFIRLSSPRFFTFVCYLHLKQRFYFSSTENSSLDGRKTLSLNTVENLQVSKFILKN